MRVCMRGRWKGCTLCCTQWVSLSIFLCKSYLCSSRSRQTRPERERGRGRGRGRGRQGGIEREARACARLSEHWVSVPAATLSARKGGGDERELIGPLLSADGCARAHTRKGTHKHSAHTRADDRRGTSPRLGLSYAKLNVLIIQVKHFRGLVLQGDALDLRYERTASGAPSASLGHRAFIAAETPPAPQCTSQAPHRL